MLYRKLCFFSNIINIIIIDIIINVWKKLPADMYFSSLGKCKRTVTLMDFSDYLQFFSSNFSFAYKHLLLYSAFVIMFLCY